MSHLTTIQTQLTDVAAIRAACAELGLTFNEGATNCTSTFFNVPCVHTISVPNGRWNIGLFPAKDGKGFNLGWDQWGHEGEILTKAVGGSKASKLMQTYAIHKATIEAKRKGYIVTRQPGKNGAVNLVVTGF